MFQTVKKTMDSALIELSLETIPVTGIARIDFDGHNATLTFYRRHMTDCAVEYLAVASLLVQSDDLPGILQFVGGAVAQSGLASVH